MQIFTPKFWKRKSNTILIKAKESSNFLDEERIQKIFLDINKRLNISVDLNSDEVSGLAFWTKLESDLTKSLEIGSIKDMEQGQKNLSLILDNFLTEQAIQLTPVERNQLLERFVAEYFGIGVLDILLSENGIFEILI